MGIRSGRGAVIHRDNFEKKYGMTPQEMHVRLGVGRPCYGCGRPGVGVIRSLVQESEVVKRMPEFVGLVLAMRAAANPGSQPKLPTIPTTYGPLVKVKEIAVCQQCFPTAERAAAKGPSWVLVEISRGPGEPKIVGQVPDSLKRG